MNIPERFIVVDDDPTNNLLCSYAIKRNFPATEVRLYLQPEVALEVIKQDYADPNKFASTVLLLDINMPVLSGWDFLDIYKDFTDFIHKQFTIYILSSSVDNRDKEKAEANGFVAGFMSKPLTKESLNKIIAFNN